MRNRDRNKARSLNNSNWQSAGSAGMMYGVDRSSRLAVSLSDDKKEKRKKDKKDETEK